MDGGPVSDNVVVDAMLGALQRERGSDQCGSIPEELDKLILAGLDFGDAANVG